MNILETKEKIFLLWLAAKWQAVNKLKYYGEVVHADGVAEEKSAV